ncbi:MAG: hypothetical protein U9O56_07825, partial [Campylobacterota bacterium]|nr:hypothetical protein [Campylobacterota bacterium]
RYTKENSTFEKQQVDALLELMSCLMVMMLHLKKGLSDGILEKKSLEIIYQMDIINLIKKAYL